MKYAAFFNAIENPSRFGTISKSGIRPLVILIFVFEGIGCFRGGGFRTGAIHFDKITQCMAAHSISHVFGTICT